ncbi:IS630 family transposase [Streptomyces sp. NPDC087228]|uniref:IS630 family transposase n=1 Tax=Streptomyces sp. NPDC087228 TaxID=3365772 RepID=UPI0038187C28
MGRLPVAQWEQGQRRRSTPQAWALRRRIILACAHGASNKDVAAQLGSTPHAVGRWRARFVQYRIAGLGDMPPPGGPRTVTDEQVAALVARTLESTPKNSTHWSTRSMAKEPGLSQSTVSRIWRAFGLQPHRSETFRLSTDPYFIDKVHDVVGLYLDPPERALVFCAGEKSQIQALDRSQPVLPMMPGVPQRTTHDYVRAGTTTLFAALAVATGKVIGSLPRRHRAEEFTKFLIKLDKEVPVGLKAAPSQDSHQPPRTHRATAIALSISGGASHQGPIARRTVGGTTVTSSPRPLTTMARKHISVIAPYASWSQLPEGRVISAV